MAKVSSLAMALTVTGDGVSERYVPAGSPIVNAAAPGGGPLNTTLAIGDNTLAVPSGAVAVMFVPPTNSTNTKKVRDVIGDVGTTIRPNAPTVLSLPTGATTLYVNSAALEVISVHWL